MGTVISGSGIALPPNAVNNEALSRIMDTSDEWIVTRSGIRQRYFADPGQGSADLGTAAAAAAIESASLERSEIDAVIFATMTPDYLLPGNGPLLQARLGLGPVPTFDIRQQCSGFLYGIELADSLLQSGKYSNVLLVGAEVHSPFMPWENGWDTTIGREDREVTEAEKEFNTRFRDRMVLFGDAAGAVVLRREDSDRGFQLIRLWTEGEGWEALSLPGVSFRRRPYVDHQQIEQGEFIPRMDGREVFRNAVTKMPDAVRQVCSEAGVEPSALDLLLVHQANLRIIESVAKGLSLERDRVPTNIERYGNTTAATLPLLWHELMSEGRIEPGMLIGFTALGSGLHWGAALYRA